MASGPIAQLLIKLGLDATGVEQGVATAKKTVGDFGGTSGLVFKGVAAGAGAAFGLMTVGATQMERAQGNFQAATGRSRDEAVAFSHDMNGLVGTAGTVGLSFDQITSAGTMVAQQFGTTGDKTKELTGQILDFAKVTKQDATGAAADLEDTLSAFGLSADDATGFMDKLVASNQKYGTEVGPQALSTLRGMSPALQAMGADLNDGIGFLNLFETAGLDAATAQRGLQTAVKNLKPGQNLDDLIAQIGAIEDPTLRAQKAIELFGTRSGTGLAAAIKPGTTSLQDFEVTADEAAGKTDKAAQDMLTTSDKFRMFGEKVGAALRDVGSQFGPLVTGLASATSLLGPTLATGLQKLATFGPIQAAGTAIGTAVGAAQAEAQALVSTGAAAISSLGARIAAMAIPLAPAGTTVGTVVGGAISAGIVLGIVTLGAAAIAGAIIVSMNDAKARVENDPASITAPQLFQGRAPMWAQARVQTAAQMQAIGQAALDAFNTTWNDGIAKGMSPSDPALLAAAKAAGEAAGGVVGTSAVDATAATLAAPIINPFTGFVTNQAPAATAAGTDVGVQLADAVTQGFQQEAPGAGAAALDAYMTQLEGQMAVKNADWIAIGKAVPSSIATGIVDAGQEVLDAGDRLIELLKNGLSPAEEAAKLEGKKYTKAVAAGVISEIPGAKQAAQEMAISAIKTIEEAAGGTPDTKGLKAIGAYYDSLMASGMDDKSIAVALAAAGVATDVIRKLTGYEPDFNDQGEVYDAHLASGISSNADALDPAINKVTSKFDLDTKTWGYKVGDAWITGFSKAIAGGAATIQYAINKATNATHGESPPKEGPLHEIDRWGENIGAAWIGGIAGAIASGAARIRAAASIAGGAFQLSPTTSMATAAAASSAGAGGGVTIYGGVTIPITVQGSADPQAVGDAAKSGVLDALSQYVRDAAAGIHVTYTTEPA